MSKQSATPHGVMEGDGSYNKHAKLPASGGALALPFLERAIRDISIGAEDRQIVIADYGSSQGKNSLAPMQLAIRKLRPRIAPNCPIVVFHIDQPSNDFNSLFEVLSSDPNGYSVNEPDVFPCAIGRSFYEKVLPADTVHLGWSSYAAVWLSQVPVPIPGHFVALRDTPVRAEFDRQAAEDWKVFLSLRASELRPGGRLIVVLPAVADDGLTGFEELMDQANAVLAEMVDQGAITAEERTRMALGTYPRRKADLLAPFTGDGRFQGLTVKECELLALPDAARADYQIDGDKEALAIKHALFFRSIFVPSLASALDKVRDGDAAALRGFGDRLQDGLERRLADNPTATDSFVEILVVAKEESA